MIPAYGIMNVRGYKTPVSADRARSYLLGFNMVLKDTQAVTDRKDFNGDGR